MVNNLGFVWLLSGLRKPSWAFGVRPHKEMLKLENE